MGEVIRGSKRRCEAKIKAKPKDFIFIDDDWGRSEREKGTTGKGVRTIGQQKRKISL